MPVHLSTERLSTAVTGLALPAVCRRLEGDPEAARAVLDAAIATGRRRLWSTVGSWNAPSLRVLEKLGFERDHITPKDDGDELVWLTRQLP
jgi:hypothetical protein